MSHISTLIILAMSMWLLNIIFGYFQIKDFNNHYSLLKKKGKVVIGRRKGAFTSGTIVLILIDEQGTIMVSKKMQGVTVFARVRIFKGLEGLNIRTLTEQHIKRYNKYLRMAILDAVKTYNSYRGGGNHDINVEVKRGIFESLFNKTKTFIRR